MKTKILVLGVTALVAWGLKRHYAEARVDDLRWILSPTAGLVGASTGTPFVMQPGEGYFSRERLFLIEKSCAGVNFMIAAVAMLVFTLLRHVVSGRAAAQVLGVSLVASYCAAVLVNAVRITVAMWLAGNPGLLPRLSAGEVHRIEGILVYFTGLVLLYELVNALDRRRMEASL
jgi:exosortase K